MSFPRQTTPRLSCAPKQGDRIARSINAVQEKCQTATAGKLQTEIAAEHCRDHRRSGVRPTQISAESNLDG